MNVSSTIDRFRKNRSAACSIKIEPKQWFSPGLAEYCVEVARVHQMQFNILPIVISNLIATICEQSAVYRANRFPMQMNLYNIIVGHSSFGKSTMIRMIERGVRAVQSWRPTKFARTDGNDVPIIFNDGSVAGVLAGLQGSTRLFICEESDITLRRMGAFLLPSVNGREQLMTEDCRAEFISFYDHSEFVKALKSNPVVVKNAKFNILGASTGELIHRALIRRIQGDMCDALFERFIFWFVDGPVIETEIDPYKLDSGRFPTIEQLSIFISYLDKVKMKFESVDDANVNDANKAMIKWCNVIRQKGYSEYKNDDQMAAKWAKSVEAVHRIASFIQIAEYAWLMVQMYIARYGAFPIEVISQQFVDRAELIYNELKLNLLVQDNTFLITLASAEYAQDVITGTLTQYQLMMNVPIGKCNAPALEQSFGATTSTRTKKVDDAASVRLAKKNKKLIKYGRISDMLEVQIMLFDSVLFTVKQLHQCRILKNASAILRQICNGLVEKGVLVKFEKATRPSTKPVTIYIKCVPDLTSVNQRQLIGAKLSTLGSDKVHVDSVIESSRRILYSCAHPPTDDVLKYLERPEYVALNLDLSPLYRGRWGDELDPLLRLGEETKSSSDSDVMSEATTNNLVGTDDRMELLEMDAVVEVSTNILSGESESAESNNNPGDGSSDGMEIMGQCLFNRPSSSSTDLCFKSQGNKVSDMRTLFDSLSDPHSMSGDGSPKMSDTGIEQISHGSSIDLTSQVDDVGSELEGAGSSRPPLTVKPRKTSAFKRKGKKDKSNVVVDTWIGASHDRPLRTRLPPARF